MLSRDSHGRAAAGCFLDAAAATAQWNEAAARLARAVARYPDSGWVRYYLAEVTSRSSQTEAIGHYRSAIERFVARSDTAGEVDARINLSVALFYGGDARAASTESHRATAVARRAGDRASTASSLIHEAWLSLQLSDRLPKAVRALREAEALVFPDGPYDLRRRVLLVLGSVVFALGRYQDALVHFSAARTLARENRDVATEAMAQYNVVTAQRRQMETLPDRTRLDEFVASARDGVALADASGQPLLRASAHRTLGDLLASSTATRDAAGPHYRSALAEARTAGDAGVLVDTLGSLARYLADTEPAEAARLVSEALRVAGDSDRPRSMAYAWRQQMRLAWKTLDREAAVRESRRALDAIETIPARQGVDSARAEAFSAWTLDYYWLIGTVLSDGVRAPADIALAFEFTERLRARVLLDALLRTAPAAAGTTPVFASLAELQRALQPHEAILSFIVGIDRNFYGEFGGGAFLFVIHRDGTRVIPVPDRGRLQTTVSIFRGLVEHPGAIEPEASVGLYDLLLREALDGLPGVTRVIVVPDGPLHHLPFAALRRAPDAPALGETHEILVVPSATVWLRLKQDLPRVASGAALVMADPSLPEAIRSDEAAEERGVWPAAVGLGRLPFARDEGRSIVSHVGHGSRLLLGTDATESAFKNVDRASYRIVHFAAHALVDEKNSDRSAIFLAGDAQGEDGLLQAREIASLSLDGQIVVLSACRSATGAVLAGEGVMGLSRAFLEAGARTVVGTLWAIRDDHAALFFDWFYRALSRGATVGAALTAARREAIAAGMPASVWSSVAAIGDDSAQPVATATAVPTYATILAGISGVALLVGIALLVRTYFVSTT